MGYLKNSKASEIKLELFNRISNSQWSYFKNSTFLFIFLLKQQNYVKTDSSKNNHKANFSNYSYFPKPATKSCAFS